MCTPPTEQSAPALVNVRDNILYFKGLQSMKSATTGRQRPTIHNDSREQVAQRPHATHSSMWCGGGTCHRRTSFSRSSFAGLSKLGCVYGRWGRSGGAITSLRALHKRPREAAPSSAPRQASCARRRRSAARPLKCRDARGSAWSAPPQGRRGAPGQAKGGGGAGERWAGA